MEQPPINKVWCHTNVRVVDCQHTWVISNFSLLDKREIETPEFTSEPSRGLKWKVALCPNGYIEDDKGFISLHLNLFESDCEPQVQCTFSIINSATLSPKFKRSFQQKMKQGMHFGYNKFMKRADLENVGNEYLVNGKLTIQCDIKVNTGNMECSQTIAQTPHDARMNQLLNDYEELFDSKLLSDFKLIVKNEEFFVHKAVLAARSPVFAAMLMSNMKESNENVATINDFDPLVIREVLRFIYCGSDKAIETLAKDILPIADKYDLGILKTLCEDSISSKLTVDNAPDILDFADLYDCQFLKKNTLAYMVLHMSEVKLTPGYQNLRNFKPSLLLELHDLL